MRIAHGMRAGEFRGLYSEAGDGAVFERRAQPDEYVLLLPEAETSAVVEANGERREINGYSITMIPPGDSRITVAGTSIGGGQVVRLISAQSPDLLELVSKAPSLTDRIRLSPLNRGRRPMEAISSTARRADEDGGSADSLHHLHGQNVPRSPVARSAKLSRTERDFEQCRGDRGVLRHHLRWPWVATRPIGGGEQERALAVDW